MQDKTFNFITHINLLALSQWTVPVHPHKHPVLTAAKSQASKQRCVPESKEPPVFKITTWIWAHHLTKNPLKIKPTNCKSVWISTTGTKKHLYPNSNPNKPHAANDRLHNFQVHNITHNLIKLQVNWAWLTLANIAHHNVSVSSVLVDDICANSVTSNLTCQKVLSMKKTLVGNQAHQPK